MSLLALLPLAAEDAATEGKKVILGMLIVGLVFLAVIAIGELAHTLGQRRKARRAARRTPTAY